MKARQALGWLPGPPPHQMEPPRPYLGEEPKAAQAADDAEDLGEAGTTAGWLEKDGERV